MSVMLSFREEGPQYEGAKAVAHTMGLSVQDYLLACIAEGHKVLKARHGMPEADLNEPTFIRWGASGSTDARPLGNWPADLYNCDSPVGLPASSRGGPMKIAAFAGRLSAMLLAVGIAAGVLAPEARAAGFDCSKASTAVEKAICGDPKLSSLDEELSAAYSKALSSAVDRDAMKAEQRRWLTQVRNKCVDALCLEEAYRVRFTEIDERPPVAVEPVQPPVQEFVATPPAETPPASAPVAEPIAEARQDAAPATVLPEPLPSAPVPVPTPAYQSPMQQAPAPTVADAQSPGNAGTVSAHAEGLTSLQMKVIGAILLLNAMVAVFLHRKGSLTIYSDYTDATFTSMAPLVALGVYFGAAFFEAPENVSKAAGAVTLALMLLFVLKSTLQANRNVLLALVALMAKLTIIVVYYAGMAFLLFGSGSARRKGERRDSFEARQRREARQSRAMMAALTAAFVFLTAWVCREDEFTSLGDYLSFRRTANA